ncbi:hypothetical protein BRADI_4g29095v3 [Brachypodium distachyon]|uniref:Uncharacterized protein n=1 Tax=Brachypodium distachyon TaxID=15368 RepID=A0A2K2CR19_BRADI|nr:hypothetical protein BRADI_4g29095v3 [Brachypodium distachyon]
MGHGGQRHAGRREQRSRPLPVHPQHLMLLNIVRLPVHGHGRRDQLREQTQLQHRCLRRRRAVVGTWTRRAQRRSSRPSQQASRQGRWEAATTQSAKSIALFTTAFCEHLCTPSVCNNVHKSQASFRAIKHLFDALPECHDAFNTVI